MVIFSFSQVSFTDSFELVAVGSFLPNNSLIILRCLPMSCDEFMTLQPCFPVFHLKNGGFRKNWREKGAAFGHFTARGQMLLVRYLLASLNLDLYALRPPAVWRRKLRVSTFS